MDWLSEGAAWQRDDLQRQGTDKLRNGSDCVEKQGRGKGTHG